MTDQPEPAEGFVNLGFLMKFTPYVFRSQSPTVEHRSSTHTVKDFTTVWGELDELSVTDLAHLYVHVRKEFEALEEARDELSKFVELVKNVKLPEAFDREKLLNVRLQDGTLVRKDTRTSCTIIDKDNGYQWLKDNGFPDVVKETVNAQTMAGIAKDILSNVEPVLNEAGEIIRVRAKDPDMPIDLPDDLFKVTIAYTTAVTKGKGKK